MTTRYTYVPGPAMVGFRGAPGYRSRSLSVAAEGDTGKRNNNRSTGSASVNEITITVGRSVGRGGSRLSCGTCGGRWGWVGAKVCHAELYSFLARRPKSGISTSRWRIEETSGALADLHDNYSIIVLSLILSQEGSIQPVQ